MKREIKNFINHFSDYIKNGEAAIFVGAGISKGSGYVNWKELLTDIAEELGLDIEKENDLIEIAQFHKNENGNRQLLDRKLIKEFTKGSMINPVHKIISNMEVEEYWTSNYDTLIEDSLKECGYKFEVKRSIDDLTRRNYKTEKTVYKMHGDISAPQNAVLVKDDYETYSDKWQPYSIAFKNALMQKTFLFLGFSFDDPNLKYILSRMKLLLSESARTHYCIMKRISLCDCNNNNDKYEYENIKQKLKIDDLKRYNINVILVEEFNEINDILGRVNKAVKYNRIFISGAAFEYNGFKRNEVEQFSYELSSKLVNLDNIITSGFGLGIGSSVINAGLEYALSNKKRVDDVIKMRPFPQNITDPKKRENLWSNYRENMLEDVGISIFMFGNKKVEDKIILSNGMDEEFRISFNLGLKIIALPFTGYKALEFYDEIITNFEKYFPDLSDNKKFIDKYKHLGSVKKLNEETVTLVKDLVQYIQRSSSV